MLVYVLCHTVFSIQNNYHNYHFLLTAKAYYDNWYTLLYILYIVSMELGHNTGLGRVNIYRHNITGVRSLYL